MFIPGKILKVKVEEGPGSFLYGRATIVDRQGSQLLIQIKTAKESNKILPKGTRLWFTNDSPSITFNGMWLASVVGTQALQGRTMLLCSTPRHEPLEQKRSWPRVAVELPVRMSRPALSARLYECTTIDLSRSGMTLEFCEDQAEPFEAGQEVALVLRSLRLDVAVAARIIRVDRHWIANKAVLGLEFVNLQGAAQQELDQVLVPLGGRPRNPELEAKAKEASLSGMATWSKTVNRMPGLKAPASGTSSGDKINGDSSGGAEASNKTSDEQEVTE
ncbi:MAG: PilZ domain-containing protein [Cyanobacteria bacterium REEB67]|nr:PilZ domain-containing protein [Cyanobacteria bacterium REEB67]